MTFLQTDLFRYSTVWAASSIFADGGCPQHRSTGSKGLPMRSKRLLQPSLGLSIFPCALLIALIIFNVYSFGDDASSGPNQIALLLCGLVVTALGYFFLGLRYREVEKRAIQSIVLAMEAMLILLIVGCLIGLWILGGIVPTMIYFGIKILTPVIFLPVVCLVCSIVSLSVGSSWSTMGTVGIALLGIGKALGFPDPLVAGAIVSGAYFGDKMSPLSDTTNLASGIAGTPLFTHIRHMMYTTIPSYTLALLVFTVISLFYKPATFNTDSIQTILTAIESTFYVHWVLLLIPLSVIILAALGISALPALTVGALLGGFAALVFQSGRFIDAEGIVMTWAERYMFLVMTAYHGFTMDSGYESLDLLLTQGGLARMYDTISLILSAMFFGGAMEATGFMQRISAAILFKVRGAASLITATIGTTLLVNIFLAEQYLAIVLTGRMYRLDYDTYRLDARNLSRALEDGGTLTSVLVPWNTCGAFAASVLGVSTLSYLPFCFFNLFSPFIAVIMAVLHIGIKEGITPHAATANEA
jgi:NhaC family Na+:H+ antiporter